MINNNQNYDKNNNFNNTLYIENRKNIIELIKLVNKALDNSSQTFYLTLYYMDLIFINKNFEKIFKLYYDNNENDITIEINKNDLVMISLSCLIIATKFNENDPNVPNIISFINLCTYYSYNKYIYKVSDLIRAEVIVLKFLEYKLNYFTLYHYFSFFFTHGFLFEKIFEKDIVKDNKQDKNELLEKIYILSREIMDEFIEDYENIDYILGNSIYFTSIQILIWSTIHILNSSFIELFEEDNKNIFELIYQIKYDENKKNNEILEKKIQKAYDNITIKEKEKEKEIKYKNNITQINEEEENNIIGNSNSKIKKINENLNYQNNNNLLISCDKYYLEKYKNNNIYLNENLKNDYHNANDNKILNSNSKNKYAFYLTKYKFISKNNKGVSKSTNNYRYKKLFQSGNNNDIKNNKYNYSSDKKKVQNEKKFINRINNNNNIKVSLDKYFNINLIKNINNNSNNNLKKEIYNYRYNNVENINNNNICNNIDTNINNRNSYNNNTYNNNDTNINNSNSFNNNETNINNKNTINNNDFHKSNNIKPINNTNFTKKYLDQKYPKPRINENNNDMVYKTKLILDKFTYPNSNNVKNVITSENFNHNKQYNYYYKNLYDNKINNIINDRYSMKENIQDNFGNSTGFNRFNNKSIDFIKEKKLTNDNILKSYDFKYNDLKSYNNEDSKVNNYFSGTFYQYGKINQYENIDKFCNSFKKSNYIPYNFKNWNKNYYY